MIVDTHCHLFFEDYASDIDEVIARARDGGVGALINVGISDASNREALALAGKYPHLYATAGYHPHEASNATEAHFDAIRKLVASEPRVVAVGEIGLDYYRNHSTPEVQKKVFRCMMDIAKEFRKPLVVHCREAEEDMIRMVEKHLNAADNPAVWHCFTASEAHMHRWIDLGHYISITGIVTFRNAEKLRAVVSEIPLERLMLETDAPYLAPQQNRGKRNEPLYLKDVCEEIARIKNISADELAGITTANACRFFGLKL